MPRPLVLLLVALSSTAGAWDPVAVDTDPLVRMPGSQPDGSVALEAPTRCLNCHAGYDEAVEPGFGWQGSMMAQAARDPIFWASYVVALQDSIWALGSPNAGDLCLRCHLPQGWVEGRSDPTNAADMLGSDFDGVHCDVCHRMVDPYFATAEEREGTDWDETDLSDTPSSDAAATTLAADQAEAAHFSLYDGDAFFDAAYDPVETGWTEAAGGQFFLATDSTKRGPFADNTARHAAYYSRFTKSVYFCGTCHDVSNPALHNLDLAGVAPGDVGGPLPTEQDPTHAYFPVERTFSEFMLSDYAAAGGAEGSGAFAPEVFDTSHPDDWIQTCQDCHMADGVGEGCDKADALTRPTESEEHPHSGVPTHDLVGGNMWVPYLLASTVSGSTVYDATNASLLGAGAGTLTLDLTYGEGLDADALLATVDRAEAFLQAAATIEEAVYDADTGELSLRVVNHTGHKLPTGYPEGRRMWLNVRAYDASGALLYEVNPYDEAVGTLVGLDEGDSPALSSAESFESALVYEARLTSTLTDEEHSFHFVLADERHKDNRIPPRGFDMDGALDRMAEPWWDGESAPDLYDDDELAGGYDQVELTIVDGADRVELGLYYQTTSREFVAFLQAEINGTGGTLSSPTPSGEAEAYIATTDPWFSGLAAWGDTLWELWEHNMAVPGAAPVQMASGEAENCASTERCDGEDNDCDGLVDEDDPDLVADTWYGDGDGDGYGDAADSLTACDAPTGMVAEGGDCDDADAAVHPGATETCNEVDDDCDGLVDDDDDGLDAATATTWYADADDDGYGDPDSSTLACVADEGWTADATDCDDTDAAVHPGAAEVCNAADDDCDGLVDDADGSLDAATATTWYADDDDDGYGDPAVSTLACDAGEGWIADDNDCDDGDATVHPGAAEVCNEADDDCDGLVDDADGSLDASTTTTWYADDDTDGFGDAGTTVDRCAAPAGHASVAGDCDDGDDAVHPDAPELCNDRDDDCDDLVDDADDDLDASSGVSWFLDGDGDGHGTVDELLLACDEPAGYSALDDDCDDGDATVYPDAAELCDELDNDCDGEVDEDAEVVAWYADADEDGHGDPDDAVDSCEPVAGRVLTSDDCDDADPLVNPDQAEVCSGIDEDCDGLVDDADDDLDSRTADAWYGDADEDGYGDALDRTLACEAPDGAVDDATDCDDADADVHPGATEVCSGIDEDCDALVDDADDSLDESTAVSWTADGDEDGHGAGEAVVACVAPDGWVSVDDDCDDAERTVYPGAPELCDELDNDCDDEVDEDVEDLSWYADRDGDGWGDDSDVVVSCAEVEDRVLEAGDCVDHDATIHPEAEDLPGDGIDQDCDGADAVEGDGGAADGGAADGGAADGGAADGGAADGGAADGGAGDGGAADGGAADGGTADGGAADGGAADGGAADGGAADGGAADGGAEAGDKGPCGCASAGSGVPGLALPLLLLGWRRRRQVGPRPPT